MTYAQFGLIQATDYNALVGGNPTTSSGTLNAVWATGGTTAGVGWRRGGVGWAGWGCM